MLKKILIAVFSLSMICADASSLDTDFDTVLGLAGLGRDSARFDTDLMAIFRDAEFPTAVYQQTISNPWRTPFFMQTLRTQLDGSITSPQDSVQAIARMLGISSRRSLLGSPIKATTVASAKKGYLKAVLTKMKEDRLLAEIPDLTGIPEPVQQAAAIILKVASDSVPYRRASFAKIGNVTDAFNQAVKT
ncbi:MAG: hypothetical protein K8R88_13375, partial [Armatimonadetes bacterium]|nr:hypothetical protein [Armatimonadota bacterium]